MENKIRLVDSHCHLDQLDLTPYDGNLEKCLENARNSGVVHMLFVSVTLKDFPNLLAIAKKYPDVSASVGLHPNEAPDDSSTERLVKFASDPKVVAIGETGLDYFRSEGDLTWQRDRFREHIRASRESKKPLIIHTRQAKEDTLKIMREENARDIGGVMHCFTEDLETAKKAMDLNFYISFSGIVTFPNAKDIQAVAKEIPLEKMLIETDAPYLAPVPHRGKSNEPAYVKHTAEFIAQLRGISVEELAEQTTKNFFELFAPV